MQTTTKRSNFVAALPPQESAPPAVVDVTPIQIGDTSAAWLSPTSATRDSISAVDRAKAHQIRQAPVYLSVGLMSIGGTVAYSLVAAAAGFGAPWAMDRLLVFLVLMAGALLVANHRATVVDFQHSGAGVERLRVQTAAEIRKAELAAELHLRTAALDAQLRMLESDRTERRRINDRGRE